MIPGLSDTTRPPRRPQDECVEHTCRADDIDGDVGRRGDVDPYGANPVTRGREPVRQRGHPLLTDVRDDQDTAGAEPAGHRLAHAARAGDDHDVVPCGSRCAHSR